VGVGGVVDVKRAVIGQNHVVVQPIDARRRMGSYSAGNVDRLAEPRVDQPRLMQRKPRLI